ncbi:MAG TPA: flagellar basal body P-ring formation chaperone FlgA [Thermodesulfobacteriota bacterium]|nr:flagellar basal body P-ring formation chaperone FlgA [Thermodesulfobacteriota bacterium]
MSRSRFLRELFFLGLFLISACWTGEASPSPLSVNFRTQASVQKEVVYLEDIASIQGSSPSLVEKVGRTKIQASPLPGDVLILSRASLSAALQRNGISSLVAQSQIPDKIEVTRPGRSMERAELSQILEDHFQRALGDEKKSVKVREIQGIDPFMVPPGVLSWEVRAPAQFYQGGNIPVFLILWAEGEKVREVRAQARVEVFAEVVVAKNSLRRHQIVEEKDVQLVNRNITQQAADVITDVGEVLGKRLTLSINTQEVLRKSMVEVPPLVKKGDRVTLLVENDHFKITCMGEVKEEGRAGDRIKVTNISSNREVYGQVLDGHTLLVDF